MINDKVIKSLLDDDLKKKLKIIVQLSDDTRFQKRIKSDSDILLIIREEKSGKINLSESWIVNGTNCPHQELNEIIAKSGKITVEVIGHCSTGAKQLQSDKTIKYPIIQRIAIDKLAKWLEVELLKEKIPDATICLIACQAARGTDKFPSLGAQLFALFNKKPEKLTARQGFGCAENKVYSHGALKTGVKVKINETLTKQEAGETLSITDHFLLFTNNHYQLGEETPINEKFVYYQNSNGETKLIDYHLYNIFHLMKNKMRSAGDEKISNEIRDILQKNLDDISEGEFLNLANYAVQNDRKFKEKSEIIISSYNKIKKDVTINTSISSFKKKEEFLGLINQLKSINNIHNNKELMNILDKTADFIEYRQTRNYSIDELLEFIIAIETIIKGKNQSEIQSGLDEVYSFLMMINSAEKIKSDIVHRFEVTHIDWHKGKFFGKVIGRNHYGDIEKATREKNSSFVKEIKAELEKMNEKLTKNSLEKLGYLIDEQGVKEDANFTLKVFRSVSLAIVFAAGVYVCSDKIEITEVPEWNWF